MTHNVNELINLILLCLRGMPSVYSAQWKLLVGSKPLTEVAYNTAKNFYRYVSNVNVNGANRER